VTTDVMQRVIEAFSSIPITLERWQNRNTKIAIVMISLQRKGTRYSVVSRRGYRNKRYKQKGIKQDISPCDLKPQNPDPWTSSCQRVWMLTLE
jgi:hypothetical protein